MQGIAGTWKSQKMIPFRGSGDGIVALFPDGFTKGCGLVQVIGKTYTSRGDTIKVEKVGVHDYRGTHLGKTQEFSVNPTGTVNPYHMGIVSIRHLDINIPLQFTHS